MIEERDLDAAVTAGVLDAATRERLVTFTRDYRRGAAGPDEEQFRLLTGFNDIFVTIAIGLVLFALGALGGSIVPALGAVLVAAASWGLAEYFTRRRRMALPSIVLLLAFVGGVFGTVVTAMHPSGAGETPPLWVALAAAAAAVAAWLHWRRFLVPITVAAGAAALGGLIIALVAGAGPAAAAAILPIVLVLGLVTFALAMAFDSRDRARVTRWTDVAFWLHLLAAPAIIHPVFALTGLLDSKAGPEAAIVVVLVYAVLTVVALAIDRRALLVSALGYVIFAIERLISSGGNLTLSTALTALVIGSFLVLLSAAWRPIRARVLALLPDTLTLRLPVAAV